MQGFPEYWKLIREILGVQRQQLVNHGSFFTVFIKLGDF